jgi:N-acetylmuramoyl-L-alanine amidase
LRYTGPFVAIALLAAGALAAGPSQAARSAGKCDRAAFRVVLDVGHTAQAPGAISARGVPEYEFNLRLAQRIHGALHEAGFAEAMLLITRGATRSALAERVRRANEARADLLLSIHHDSVPDFLLATWEFLGAEGRHSDRFKGYSIFVSRDNARYRHSLAFARQLGRALKAQGLVYTPHYTLTLMGSRRRQLVDAEAGVYRFDQLIVLKDTRVPAVLLEAGSIIHRDEELLMQSPERQSAIAAAVVDGVERYCASRPPRSFRRR